MRPNPELDVQDGNPAQHDSNVHVLCGSLIGRYEERASGRIVQGRDDQQICCCRGGWEDEDLRSI